MTDREDSEPQVTELQGVLAKRLLVAGGLVGVLLLALAFFDRLAAPDDTPEPPVFTKPVPVPPKKPVTQPVTPSEAPSPVPPPSEDKAPPLPPPAAVVVEPPPAPEVAAKPDLPKATPAEVSKPEVAPMPQKAPAGSVAKPALVPVEKPPASTATVIQSKPAPAPAPAAAAKSPAPAPAPVLEGTAVPEAVKPEVSKPAAVSVAPKPAEVARPAPQPTPRLFSGYVVQAGVFTSTKAAEELHARLTLNGIPSTLETRVQVGPFKNKEEADAARRKLKELGIEGLMIPPAGARR